MWKKGQFGNPGVVLVARYFEGKPAGRYLEIFGARVVIERLKRNMVYEPSSKKRYPGSNKN